MIEKPYSHLGPNFERLQNASGSARALGSDTAHHNGY
jgi:hypothetical protein